MINQFTPATLIIDRVRKTLILSEIPTARLDAEILVAHVLGMSRGQLLAKPDLTLSTRQQNKLNSLVNLRCQRTPLAYILGYKEFYGCRFMVTTDVLIPRPESEDIIDLAKEVVLPGESVLDIGTGCGCLAICLALLRSDVRAHAIDLSAAACRVARRNATELQADVTVVNGDGLRPALLQKYAVLLANLPYVPQDFDGSPELGYEPPEALYSGPDGLAHYRRLFTVLRECSPRPRAIVTESLQSQHQEMSRLAGLSGYRVTRTTGLVQLMVSR